MEVTLPRPRTPTEVLELRGSFKKNPDRKRPVGPKSPQGLGDPPEYLAEDERACWVEAVGNAPGGVLTSENRLLVEVVARLLAKFRRDWLSGAELAQLTQSIGRLGWTPVDRSKVVPAGEKPKEDEFAEFRVN